MPTTFLCDTNILGELARPVPNPRVVSWANDVRSVSLSVVTVEEILYGLTWKPNPRARAWLEAYLANYCEVLPITTAIAERSGLLRGQLQARGRTRSQADMLIAATAQLHSLTLASRNARDFEDCGIPIFDPFA